MQLVWASRSNFRYINRIVKELRIAPTRKIPLMFWDQIVCWLIFNKPKCDWWHTSCVSECIQSQMCVRVCLCVCVSVCRCLLCCVPSSIRESSRLSPSPPSPYGIPPTHVHKCSLVSPLLVLNWQKLALSCVNTY